MTNSKRTWTVVAIAGVGALGVGTALGISAADASSRKAPAHRAAATAAVPFAGRDVADHLAVADLGDRAPATGQGRRAVVVTAVLAAYPHARIVALTARGDGAWRVVLVTRDQRTGTVAVDRHLHVGALTTPSMAAAPSAPSAPSATDVPPPASSEPPSSVAPPPPASSEPASSSVAPPPSSSVPAPAPAPAPAPTQGLGGDGAVSGPHW